jgi:hypothetical protein
MTLKRGCLLSKEFATILAFLSAVRLNQQLALHRRCRPRYKTVPTTDYTVCGTLPHLSQYVDTCRHPSRSRWLQSLITVSSCCPCA